MLKEKHILRNPKQGTEIEVWITQFTSLEEICKHLDPVEIVYQVNYYQKIYQYDKARRRAWPNFNNSRYDD